MNKRILQRANLLQTLQQNTDSGPIPLSHATIEGAGLQGHAGLQSTDSGIDIGSDGAAFEDPHGNRYSRQGGMNEMSNAYHS